MIERMKKKPRVGIVGAGPAGIAAAVQLKRSGLLPVLFERDKIGGLLHNANRVENYPGFPEGITGPRLVSLFDEHLAQYDLQPVYEEVLKAEYPCGHWVIYSDRSKYQFDYLVFATGTTPKTGNYSRYSKRVFYEVTSLPQKNDMEIGIIGGGDAAFDYALNLARHHRVHLFYRSQRPRSISLLQEEADKEPMISIYSGCSVKEVFDEGKKVCLIMNSHEDAGKKYRLDYLLVAIGRIPRHPEIIHSEKNIRPSRLYFAGDVQNRHYRQTAIAVGDGIKTAMEILYTLEK